MPGGGVREIGFGATRGRSEPGAPVGAVPGAFDTVA